ncbi:MAG: LL-diaminopimelate aminotransferase [Deltaproteobacteria bacterium]|nr:LL-diaminopimelate aminotransferase [Deltaproteobacteria bacterium]
MADINANYLNLRSSYLFSEIAARVAAHAAKNPDQKIIRLGIGDVTQPLVPSVIKALQDAVNEQSTAAGFKGYGPEQGYDFLREAIVKDSYPGLGIGADEIFVSDGAKCDVGNFQELFATGCKVAITDPVYPVYADANVMAGRGGAPDGSGRFAGMIYLPCTAENGFVPELPKEKPDLIYLCYPNNPTGTVLTRDQLKVWVDYARKNDAIIFYDSAYECFIREPGIPHSIYEVDGAREVAVEFRSYSKTAGFTGLRCGYAVVPKTVTGKAPDGSRVALNTLWNRRQTTKYNGCPYIVQRAAEAVHSAQGKKEVTAVVEGYLANSKLIKNAFEKMGLTVVGGTNAPYVWVKVPMNSWDFFTLLLEKAGVVGTPGAGFGPSGQEYFRLTGFGSPENTREAIERLRSLKL